MEEMPNAGTENGVKNINKIVSIGGGASMATSMVASASPTNDDDDDDCGLDLFFEELLQVKNEIDDSARAMVGETCSTMETKSECSFEESTYKNLLKEEQHIDELLSSLTTPTAVVKRLPEIVTRSEGSDDSLVNLLKGNDEIESMLSSNFDARRLPKLGAKTHFDYSVGFKEGSTSKETNVRNGLPASTFESPRQKTDKNDESYGSQEKEKSIEVGNLEEEHHLNGHHESGKPQDTSKRERRHINL